ncbi:MAG: ADP-ribosylglycohydrolase family protein [Myxococcota bacterium]
MGRSRDFECIWSRIPKSIGHPSTQVLIKQESSHVALGEGWVAEEAVASAMYCFWRHPNDFRAAVLLGANTDGDSDSIACITGGVLGARLGKEAIPAHWCRDIENAQVLEDLATQFVSKVT